MSHVIKLEDMLDVILEVAYTVLEDEDMFEAVASRMDIRDYDLHVIAGQLRGYIDHRDVDDNTGNSVFASVHEDVAEIIAERDLNETKNLLRARRQAALTGEEARRIASAWLVSILGLCANKHSSVYQQTSVPYIDSLVDTVSRGVRVTYVGVEVHGLVPGVDGTSVEVSVDVTKKCVVGISINGEVPFQLPVNDEFRKEDILSLIADYLQEIAEVRAKQAEVSDEFHGEGVIESAVNIAQIYDGHDDSYFIKE